MNNSIPYGKQNITDEDIASVVSVLKSDYLTQGPEVSKFEKKIAEKVEASYCVAVSNGTAALHVAVAALGISEGAEGLTSPITFSASANCMIYNGICPGFADIDEETYTIDPSAIESKLTDKTRLVIPVHFAGQPADMDAVSRLARKNRLSVIEDAAHAIGSRYANGKMVGSCCYSDMTIFSFHPVKTMTCGEGGAITTNNKKLYEKLLMLRSHGITKDPARLKQTPGPWYYEMQELGFNYRLTDIQAALGTSQLRKLDEFKKRRREIVDFYNRELSGMDVITVPKERKGVDSCFHLYVLKIRFDMIKKSRKDVMLELRSHGIGTQVHYIPVHTLPYYQSHYHFKKGMFPNAEQYYREALSIPLYPAMTDDDAARVIKTLKGVLNR